MIPFISCSSFTNENDGYENALETWKAEKSTDYEFKFRKGCFCPTAEPAIIEVRADTVFQVLSIDTREILYVQIDEQTQVPAMEFFPDYYITISELFDVIKNARNQKADRIMAEFNQEIGYPLSISIDYLKNAVDDEVGYTISNYKKLPPLLTNEK